MAWIKHLRVLWCMLETFCFGGLHYGWHSLLFVFKEEGFFSDQCDPVNVTDTSDSWTADCDYQDGQFSLMYSVANGVSIIPIFLCGTCISRFGPVTTRIVWICLFALGCVMVMISSPDMPWFACAGIMLFAGGGRVFLLTNMQISNLYQTGSFIVIALMSGCFDSSSSMTLFVKLAYEAGVSIRISFAVILGLSMTAFVNTYVNFKLLNSKRIEQESVNDDSDGDNKVENGGWTLGRIYRRFVCNAVYISHFTWFTLLVTHFTFFLSTSNYYIGKVSDSVDGSSESSLTNFLSYTMIVGIAPALIAGLFLEQFQHQMKGSVYIRNLKTTTIAFITTTLLSVVLAILSIFRVLYVVYINFIILPIFRGFLFAMAYSFIAKAFPGQAFGALSALIDAQTCVILFLQRGLFQWLQSYDDAELHIRITLAIISVIALSHPLLLIVKIRQISNKDADSELSTSEVDCLKLDNKSNLPEIEY